MDWSSSQIGRRSFIAGSSIALVGAGAAAGRWMAWPARALPPGVDAEELAEMRLPPPSDPEEALERLLNGNQLFVSEYFEIGDLRRGLPHRLSIAENQAPFALIVGCADSRVSPELLFNTGLGDLFVVRVVGHIVDPRCFSVTGSIEYAVHELHVPLVMVLGHERCGAVKAAIRVVQEDVDFADAIDAVAEAIRPVVERVSQQPGDLVALAVESNVRHAVNQLKTSMPVLDQPLMDGRLKIVGAVYDLDTGRVRLVE